MDTFLHPVWKYARAASVVPMATVAKRRRAATELASTQGALAIQRVPARADRRPGRGGQSPTPHSEVLRSKFHQHAVRKPRPRLPKLRWR